jgi:hypothetical protein
VRILSIQQAKFGPSGHRINMAADPTAARLGSILPSGPKKAVAWPTVTGRVTASHIDAARVGLQVRFIPVVLYRYPVGGTEYEGSRLAFALDVTAGSKTEAEQLVHSYVADSAVQVRYDARNPSLSVFRPGASLWFLSGIAFVALLFIVPGATAVWLAVATS